MVLVPQGDISSCGAMTSLSIAIDGVTPKPTPNPAPRPATAIATIGGFKWQPCLFSLSSMFVPCLYYSQFPAVLKVYRASELSVVFVTCLNVVISGRFPIHNE